MSISKVSVKALDTYRYPLEEPVTSGGRIMHPAGEITQITNGDIFRFMSYVEFDEKAGTAHGNHFHETRVEFLYVLKGKLRAIYKDLDTDEAVTLVLQTGDLVEVRPRCAHVYLPLEYSQAIEFSSSTFDAADIHTYTLSDE